MKLFCCSLLVSVSCWAQEPIDYFDQAFLSGANLLPPIVQIKQVEVAASDIGMLEFREQGLKVTKKSGLFPLVSNGDQLVITGQTGQILVLDQITGQELWRDQWSDWVFPPAFSDDGLIFAGKNALMMKLDSQGKVIWHQTLTSPATYSPLLMGEQIMLMTQDRQLTWYNSATGKKGISTHLASPGKRLFKHNTHWAVLLQNGDLIHDNKTIPFDLGKEAVAVQDGRWLYLYGQPSRFLVLDLAQGNYLSQTLGTQGEVVAMTIDEQQLYLISKTKQGYRQQSLSKQQATQ